VTGLRTLRPYVLPEWRALGGAMVATVAVVAVWLARPLPLALVVNRLLTEDEIPFDLTAEDWRLVALVAGIVIAIGIVGAVGEHIADDLLTKAGERVTHRLRMATYARLQRLALSFHERRHPSELVSRVTGDVSVIGALFPGALGNLASSTTLLAGMLAVSIVIDPLLALTAFVAAPALAVVSFVFRPRVKEVGSRQRAKEGELRALSDEAISSVRVVKAFGAERFEEERLRRRSEELHDLELEASDITGRFSGITDILGAFALALVLVVGVVRVAAGAVTAGELVIMWTYARRIDRPLRAIARDVNRLSRGLTRAERVAEILAADEFLEEAPDAYSGPRAKGDLELQQVSFSYDPERPTLVDLTLKVPAGERLALMGRSGAGKSTLAALIARFYDPPDGRGHVLIDGRDLRDCSLDWLRKQVGLVLQDTVLFTGTVAENIAYGLDTSRERVIAAAKAAGADGFIAQLPEGYDSTLGPRGTGLSGGQRQRIAVARTLLRDPAVLVLDEPTTGLDAESESEVLDGLRALMQGRTTIIVTHSERLARTADRVVVVDEGRVARDGPPDEVLRAPRARTVAAPSDPALPRLPDLLNSEVMTEVLGRHLRGATVPPDVRIRYLRYKPETNLVVQYDVGVDGHWHTATAMIARSDLSRRARKPANVSLARDVNGRSPAAHPLIYEQGLGALIQWLPLDLSLPALAAPPERLHPWLRARGVSIESEGPVSLLAYKARRRAVIRIGSHVLKFYSNADRFDTAVAGLRAGASLPSLDSPRFVAALRDRLVTVQSYFAGEPVSRADLVAERAGSMLGWLHDRDLTGLRILHPGDQLKAAARSARLVARVTPSLGRRLERLLRELELSMPRDLPLVPSHGDFHAHQLLTHADCVAVTDLDNMALAPRALDLATYPAHLVRGNARDLATAGQVMERLADGYGGRPPALGWYLAASILRRAPVPFRYVEPGWRERVESIVEAAEAAHAGR
jgi:ATP-binding cassette, subfamily B, bacterial